jgi:hypothetical protein
LPVGSYDLIVNNSGIASAPFRIGVVVRKPGIVTVTSDVKGPAQATLEGGLALQRNRDVGKIGVFDTRPARVGNRVDL